MSDITTDRLNGIVSGFDDARGLGEIDVHGATVPFHCVSIADGSRTIAIGTSVTFVLLAKLGRREAGDIRPS